MSITRRKERLASHGLWIACALLMVLFVGAQTVRAELPPPFLFQFCEPGASAGQCNNPRGVAADPATGHVFISENTNRRVSEFTSWGQFVKAWGWGVLNGASALQTCTELTGCLQGKGGGGVGELNGPIGIAVDSAHAVYVVDQANRRVQKFNSAGEFVLMFGGKVNKTKVEEVGSTEAEQNLCTAASGNVCQIGTAGTGKGQFGAWKTGAFIAVDSSDTVYVGDNSRIEKFNAGGEFEEEIPLPGYGFVESLVVDPEGDIYVVSQSFPALVRKLTPTGSEIYSLEDEIAGKPVPKAPQALAADPAGSAYVADGSSEPILLKFKSTGKVLASWGSGDFGLSKAIGAGLLGDGSSAPGDVYVANSIFGNGYVRAYGPLPQFEPPPTAQPTIEAQYASAVGPENATLDAEVDPRFRETEYFVEYGTTDCSLGTCTRQPEPPAILSANDRGANTVAITVPGLTPGTTYHYRFVAINECRSGDECVAEGNVHTFHTPAASALALPDTRAYELVSPTPKNSAEVGVPTPAGGAAELSVQPLQATPAGDAITYTSSTAFGDPRSAPAASQYLSRRNGSGWSTENLDPLFEEGFLRDPYVGFSPDLSHAAMIAIEPTLTADAAAGFPDTYRRDNATGALTAITTEANRPEISVTKHEYCLSYGGASTDFEHVIFAARGALIPGDPIGDGFNLYEWSGAEGLRLVSVLPSGTPAAPNINTGFGGKTGTFLCTMRESLLRHAISADGSRIFWTSASAYSEGSNIVIQPLLARVNHSETVQLDALQGGTASISGEGRYQDASSDGSKVFFTDGLPLTAGATASAKEDLYLYDFEAPAGERLSDLTVDPTEPADVLGVIGASRDGSYVYFVARASLTGEEQNAAHEKAQAGQNNLYVWHEGMGLRFIAALAATPNLTEGDATDWVPTPGRQTARVTPDGRNLAFLSAASLTGFDNTVNGASGCTVGVNGLVGSARCTEVYLYDFAENEVTCASCNPSGARPLGPASIPTWRSPYEQPRYLSDDGNRLFFETLDALDPHDTNSKRDVYAFERTGTGSCNPSTPTFDPSSNGCVFLISTGSGADESYLLDASVNGNDTFISTRQRLVARDEDERYDIYDARVGGSEQAPTPSTPCGGEACRPREGAPAATVPNSDSFTDGGNIVHGGTPRPSCQNRRRSGKRHSARCRPRHRRARDQRRPRR